MYIINIRNFNEEGICTEGRVLVNYDRLIAVDETYQDAGYIGQYLFFLLADKASQVEYLEVEESAGDMACWFYLKKEDRPQKHVERAKRRHNRSVAVHARGKYVITGERLNQFSYMYEEGRVSKTGKAWRQH